MACLAEIMPFLVGVVAGLVVLGVYWLANRKGS